MRYYIQDTRSYVGNSVLWWRVGGAGYTANVDEAGTYSEEEAERIRENRPTDKPIPEDVVKESMSMHVDVQKMHKVMRQRGLK
jgi:hypothetical protein